MPARMRRRIKRAVAAGVAAVLSFAPIARGTIQQPPARPERPAYRRPLGQPASPKMQLRQMPQKRPGTIPGLGARGGGDLIAGRQRTVRPKIEQVRMKKVQPQVIGKKRLRRERHRG